MTPDLQPLHGASNYAQDLATKQNRVLRNTYWLLALSLIPTMIGTAVGTHLDTGFLRTNPVLSLVAILAIFYGWIYAIERNKNSGLGLLLLLGFTFFLGALLGPLMQRVLGFRNGTESVMLAAGGTVAVFTAMSAIATVTRRDLGRLGNFLAVGAIVIMLAVVGNAFFNSPALHLAILAGFVLLSSLIILHQVNEIVRGGETNYIAATLTLYIAIYNLFSSLLQLLGILGDVSG
jgi:modulator of FtsH protease